MRNGQQGFSVVEALVAVALVALAFTPLLALQGQMSRTAAAAERAEIAIKGESSALAFLETVNPLMRRSGEEDLGFGVLSWRATAMSDLMPVRADDGAHGRYSAQLFRIDAAIAFDDGRVTAFSVRKAGWRAETPLVE